MWFGQAPRRSGRAALDHELIGADAEARLEAADEVISAYAGGARKFDELKIAREMSLDELQRAALLGGCQSRLGPRAAKHRRISMIVPYRAD